MGQAREGKGGKAKVEGGGQRKGQNRGSCGKGNKGNEEQSAQQGKNVGARVVCGAGQNVCVG